MIRKRHIINALSILLANYAISQQIDFSNRLEFSGNLTYKSSSIEEPNNSNEQTIPPILVDKTLKILPSIGYCFTPNFEFLIEPRYTLRIQKVETSFLIYAKSYQTYTLYQPGFSLGLYYQSLAIDKIIPFVGCRIGWNWSKTKMEYDGSIILVGPKQGWSKPEFSFPSFAAGLKFFVSDHWAFVPQLQYTKINNWSGLNNLKDTDVDFVLGITVLY